MSTLRIVRMSPGARMPTKGSDWSAGYDLYASADVTVGSRDRACIPTDLVVAVPPGTYGRIAPRSGLALQHFIDVGAGVIDGDYRGPLGVVLFNHGLKPFAVKRGDRIAQLICEKIVYPELKEVEGLETTNRGEKGFGSTSI
jgi:dUTP pyrophosphatase